MVFKNIMPFILIFLFAVSTAMAQEKVTISGTVKDQNTNEKLIGVNILLLPSKMYAVTNEYGFFSVTVPANDYTLDISYVGYETVQREINATKDIRLNIDLREDALQLSEVIVGSKSRTNTRNTEMSVAKITMAEIKKMPVVLGESDILKSILTLPGVTNAGEGQSGFNVRGGAVDQNLILLDEATIYNSSHLFGFFSVFNSDAIKDLKLYKGGIPARFGGRVSSVLDIYQKEGNSKDFSMTGGVGLISSRLLAEGPIVKDKGSFLVAGRSSYAHLFLKLTDNENSAYFYDLNTKLSYNLNENNNIYFSGYFGRDVFNINDNFENTFGNTIVNLRWNHLFSDKIFSNMSLIYSDYYYGLTLDFVGFNWDSSVKNYNFKYDLKQYVNDKIKLSYGINSIYYDFDPGSISPSKPDSGINPFSLDKKYAFENAAYIDVEQKISEKWQVSYGLRLSSFLRLGNQEVSIYENDQAVKWNNELKIYEKATPIGSRNYSKNQTIASFANLEPRLAVSYSLDDDQSIKASYNRMTQYLHLVSNTASPTPLDIWTPSDDFQKPQLLDQVALGYFRNFSNDKYSLEVETFYKEIKNRIDYIDGADLIANNNIEQVLLNGRARAYGLEVLLRKNTGDFSGWIAYTLSTAEQQTAGRTAEELGISNGDWYKSGYDKTHNLSVVGSYFLNKKWTFGSIFSLQSGQATTFPTGYYEYQGMQVPQYGARNASRLPAYHRLDVSATLTPRKNEGRKWQGEWVFGIYNIYNRKNAASISFRQNEDSGQNESVKLSIFGIIPSVTYNFKF